MNDFLTYMVGKLGRGQPPTPTNIGWNISPKVNAVFRCGTLADKEALFNGFVGKLDKDEALKIATRCHREQTTTVKNLFDELDINATHMKNSIVVLLDGDYKEYTGLLASKFMQKYNKPAFVLREADGINYSGSFRSPIPIIDILNSSGIISARGHSVAAGVILKKGNTKNFFEWFDTIDLSRFIGEIPVTACIAPKDVTENLCYICESNEELYGHGVERPTFFIESDITTECVQVFRKRTNTVKITVNGIDFLLFFANDAQVNELTFIGKKHIEMIVTLSLNVWNNTTKPQGKIQRYELNSVKDDVLELNWNEIFR